MDDSRASKRYRLRATQQPVLVRKNEVPGKQRSHEVQLEGSKRWLPAIIQYNEQGEMVSVRMALPEQAEVHDFEVESF